MRYLFVSVFVLVGSVASAGPFHRTYYSTCYTPQYYYPSYSYSYPSYSYAPSYTAPAPPVYSSDWKTEAVKYAEKKDDYNNFLKTMQALGVNYAGTAYATEAAYPGQANTLYGYSYSTIKEAYGSLDMNQLMQTSARLTQQARESASQAHTEFQSNIGSISDAQARVAEILAKGQSAAATLAAANAQPTTKTTTTTTVLQPNATGPLQASAVVSDPSMAEFMRTIATPACASCHSGPQAKAKFDIATYPTLSPAQKQAVLERLTTTDLTKRMPRLADGKPGTLSAEGIKGFATH